jgi:hypothetical protein
MEDFLVFMTQEGICKPFNAYPHADTEIKFDFIVVCVLCIKNTKIFENFPFGIPEYLPFIFLVHIKILLCQDASNKVMKVIQPSLAVSSLTKDVFRKFKLDDELLIFYV